MSAQLPLQTGTHAAKKVQSYLFGLLPENDDARAAWSDQLGVDADDAFSILGAMGWDCPGAVQFCQEEDLEQFQARDGEYEPVSETQIADRIRGLGAGEPSWTMPGEHWSLGGQQEKFALAHIDGLWYAAHGSAPTTHIIKPGIKLLRHQALIEHVTMAAAAALGLDIAASAFARFGDAWAIVVERFDRDQSAGRVRRIHQEDFAQACGRMPAQKYESRGGPGLADMMRALMRESTDLMDDRLALADFLIINLVAGAPDGHAKNISLLRSRGFIGVAPLYDLATGLAYDSTKVERTVAVSIGGERHVSRIRKRQWESAAKILNLDPRLLVDRAAVLAEAFPGAYEATLAQLGDSAPGIDEVADRTVPALTAHSRRLLEQL